MLMIKNKKVLQAEQPWRQCFLTLVPATFPRDSRATVLLVVYINTLCSYLFPL